MEAKIYKKEKGYQIYFLGKYNTFNKDIEDVKEIAYNLNYDYFSQNKHLLPKGIIINETKKTFVLNIRLDHKKVKYIKSSKDLSMLIEIRKHIIMNLLDLF